MGQYKWNRSGISLRLSNSLGTIMKLIQKLKKCPRFGSMECSSIGGPGFHSHAFLKKRYLGLCFWSSQVTTASEHQSKIE
ncbi:hypothetical protein QN277_008002 [Acacia crassicarpa]|uniref:Uncharacterized protein n=1 Tax=Acacia crassicarpa TaxID=499986 RepID=A0AAE1JNW0_9FABA|nr:hypothetical protein QN277_008002 [Acacia crassicarpa]